MQNSNIETKSIFYVSIISFSIAIIKLIVGILSNSIAVIASAIDSILDGLVSLFNLFAIKKSKQTPNKTFNYGVGKIESLAILVEGIAIAISGGYIIFASVQKYLSNEFDMLLDIAIYMMIASIGVAIVNVLILKNTYKKTKNEIIKADITHYTTDIYTNIGILISLFLILWTDFLIIDIVVSLIVGIYILYSASTLIKSGISNVLDRSLEDEDIEKIKSVINANKQANGYHLLKTRSSAGVNFVEFHLELYPEILLYEAYDISKKLEKEIKNIDKMKKWVIEVRLDPYSDDEHKLLW